MQSLLEPLGKQATNKATKIVDRIVKNKDKLLNVAKAAGLYTGSMLAKIILKKITDPNCEE